MVGTWSIVTGPNSRFRFCFGAFKRSGVGVFEAVPRGVVRFLAVVARYERFGLEGLWVLLSLFCYAGRGVVAIFSTFKTSDGVQFSCAGLGSFGGFCRGGGGGGVVRLAVSLATCFCFCFKFHNFFGGSSTQASVVECSVCNCVCRGIPFPHHIKSVHLLCPFLVDGFHICSSSKCGYFSHLVENVSGFFEFSSVELVLESGDFCMDLPSDVDRIFRQSILHKTHSQRFS